MKQLIQALKKSGAKSLKIKVKFKRSNVKPITKEDKILSIRHLKDSIAYNKRHIADHRKAEHHGGSKKYNEAHIKGHEKAMKKDKKLIEERQDDIKKRPTAAKAKKMLADNSAQGHPLTKKQKGYFGFIAGGGVPTPKPRALNKLKRGMRGYAR